MAYRIAVIPGDGIGPEVVAEGLKVLEAARRARVTGRAPSTTSARAAGTPRARPCPTPWWPSWGGTTRSCWARWATPACRRGCWSVGCCCRLRFELDHHVNLRPVRLYPGVVSPLGKGPAEIDFVVCREGTEGPYAGTGGFLRGHAAGGRHRGEHEHRIRRGAGGPGRLPPGPSAAAAKLTLVHKTNVLVHAGQPVAAGTVDGWLRSSPTWRPTTCTSTRRRCSS